MNNADLYQHDFNEWIYQQICLLKQGKVNEIDVEHLIEELEDMGNSTVREMENHFLILIAQLLKWQFQPMQQRNNWRSSINEQRILLLRLLREIPSLKRECENAIAEVYSEALGLAIDETGLTESTFPQQCPYSVTELLDKQFYPAK